MAKLLQLIGSLEYSYLFFVQLKFALKCSLVQGARR